MKVHYSSIERATESDNQEWAWILCEKGKDRYQDPEYTDDWSGVTCRRCLRSRKEGAK